MDYESTQTITKCHIERFCDIKTLEYTTYEKDKLVVSSQEYISRLDAFKELNSIRMQAEDSKERNACTRMVIALLEVPVSNVPTADVVEVRHGHWKDNCNGTFTCSECGGNSSKMDWCGRCGAKMDGKVEGE